MDSETVNAATKETPSLEMQGRSAIIGELVGALAAAQTEFNPIKKTVLNTQFNSRYADLDAVIDATRPALSKHGIVIMQFSETDVIAKQLTMRTVMAHKSGQWIETKLTLPATMREKFDAQSIGSAMTYARRYSWQGMVGVAAEVDDDGNQASDKGSKEAAQAVAAEKIAKAKGKPGPMSVAPNGGVPEALAGHPESIQMLLKKSTESFRKDDTDHKRPYRVLEGLDSQDRTLKLYCFDNAKYDVYGDGKQSGLFDMLDLAATFEQPVSFKVAYEKNYVVVRKPIGIANVAFDEDGLPMLDNKRG